MLTHEQPSLHAKSLADGLLANPSLADWLPFDVKNEDDLLAWLESQRQVPVRSQSPD